MCFPSGETMLVNKLNFWLFYLSITYTHIIEIENYTYRHSSLKTSN